MMYIPNVTEALNVSNYCPINSLTDLDWANFESLSLFLLLCVINVLVILGNVLVIAAVVVTPRLRGVTNFLIVSLAAADLTLGVVVLPFSALLEVFHKWMFGRVMCSVWLATDVWMCTASIFNLCAISLDRFIAVTRPVRYPSIMTSRKGKILIASVWVISFVICFPPLVGWNDSPGNTILSIGSIGEITNSSSCEHLQCELISERGYVVYSACGSFFLPMFVMMFFYWRIYVAAVSTTKAINQGFRLTKHKKLSRFGETFEGQRMTLRIHRGCSTNASGKQRSDTNRSIQSTGGGSGSCGGGGEQSSPSIQSNGNVNNNALREPSVHLSLRTFSGSSSRETTDNPLYGLTESESERTTSFYESQSGIRPNKKTLFKIIYKKKGKAKFHSGAEPSTMRKSSVRIRKDTSNSDDLPPPPPHSPISPKPSDSGGVSGTVDNASTGSQGSTRRKVSKMGRRNIRAQVKRFRMETKAAKTLGIIVGCFIMCWLPFFIIYVVRGFCGDCISPVVFSFFFWLGYCNSALNPCIYAMFSKDFRHAFKKVICKFMCCKRPTRKKELVKAVALPLSSHGDEEEKMLEDKRQN